MNKQKLLDLIGPAFLCHEINCKPIEQIISDLADDIMLAYEQPDISECENKYKQLEQHYKVLEYSYNACFEELTKLKTKIEPDISEDVEKAAENYANAVYPHKEQTDSYFDNVKNYLSIGFIAGAEYQSQQPIPTVDEDAYLEVLKISMGYDKNHPVIGPTITKRVDRLKEQFSITRK